MPTTTRPSRLAAGRVVALAALLTLLTGACSSGTDAGAPGGATPGTGPVDTCAQIPAAEVAGVIGPNSPPQPATEGEVNSCTWENPDTNYSITLEVGAAGTAPGGRLPDPDPGQSAQPIPDSDGMLLVATDQVEFAAGDRLCFLQVVTDPTQRDKDRATSIRMAGEIRGRL